MKSLIFSVLTVALYGTAASAAPVAQPDAASLGKRNPKSSWYFLLLTKLAASRIIHPCPLACPAGSYIQGCGCFPIEPLPPTKRRVHCDLVCPVGEELDPNTICTCVKVATPTSVPGPYLKDRSPSPQSGPAKPVCRFVCLPGTAHDPNGPLCNCNLITTGPAIATPVPDPYLNDRSPSPQDGPAKPVCHFVCLPGTAHDPNGPTFNCNLTTTSPAAATPVVAARDALPSLHCNLICEMPGYHTSPNGCECIKDTAVPVPEKRDPLTGRKCLIVCEEPGYHTSDNGCGCVPDKPATAEICPQGCPVGSVLTHPGCKCVGTIRG